MKYCFGFHTNSKKKVKRYRTSLLKPNKRVSIEHRSTPQNVSRIVHKINKTPVFYNYTILGGKRGKRIQSYNALNW